MPENLKITLIEEECANGQFCFKVPKLEVDDFGNESLKYLKEFSTAEDISIRITNINNNIDKLNSEKSSLEERLDLINN